MGANLIQQLSLVKDFRTQDGQRHPLWLVLLLVIMGTMSGYTGYRALGDFVKRHRTALIKSLSITKQRLPSYSTIRRVMMGIDFADFAQIFNSWAQNYVQIEECEWLAVDGKSIKGTVSDYASQYQNFVSIVSIFSAKQGMVLRLDKLDNKQTSEITTVQSLLKALDLEGVVLSLDALHCQKKTPS